MHFSLAFALTTLLSLSSAAVLPLGESDSDSSVCGALQTPLCCQLDVLGVVNLNCENAGDVEDLDDFYAVCAESGRTAECCVLPVGADGLVCTAA